MAALTVEEHHRGELRPLVLFAGHFFEQLEAGGPVPSKAQNLRRLLDLQMEKQRLFLSVLREPSNAQPEII
jgi:hypothetical protein